MNRKIFQIGFNKCGTASLHHFFKKNGLVSAHFEGGLLAETIFSNAENNMPLLSGIEQFDAYTDMEHITEHGYKYVAEKYFKQLYEQYPDSVFILNTRNIEQWLSSRIKHNKGSYLTRYRCIMDVQSHEIIEHWRKEYQEHVSEVLAFFANKPTANFYHLDLDKNGINDIGNYLSSIGFKMNVTQLGHTHKTKKQENTNEQNLLNNLLDLVCHYQYENPTLALHLCKQAQQINDNVYGRKKLRQLIYTNEKYKVKSLISRLKCRINNGKP